MAENEKEIYWFLKTKLKERNIQVNEFYNKCGISKATLYRIMKGYQKPRPEHQVKIIEILKLDEFEKEAFFECIKMLEFDENEIEAFAVIDSIFVKNEAKISDSPIEFIVYDDRKSVMTFDEILNIISDMAVQDDFYCDIAIYSCCRDNMLIPIKKSLLELGKKIKAEHFVRFYENDDLENVLTFKSVIPLLKHSTYDLFARTLPGEFIQGFMDDIILIKMPNKYMVLSFNGDKYNECYISSGAKWYTLFLNKLDRMRPLYDPLIRERNINLLLELYHTMENDSDSAVFKSNPCYNMIEAQIWTAITNRFTEENYEAFYQAIGDKEHNRSKADVMLHGFIDILDRRYNHSFRNTVVNLFTKEGLEKFVQTGRLSDHYGFLPNFTKEETASILQNLLARHSDPDDKLKIGIVDKHTDEDLCIAIYNDGNITIEYNDIGAGDIFNCFFEHKQLAELFMDFAVKYAPDKLVMSDREMREFLERLIK